MRDLSFTAFVFNRVSLFAIIALSGYACGYFGSDKDERPLARVKDKFLYASDIPNLTGKRTTPEDSQVVVTSYVNNWITEMLLLDKAELNLREEQKDFEKQLESYRNSLLIYEYEKKIIQQNLDTNVTLEEIEDYYITNQQNFTLKEDLIKVTYARISKHAPNIDKIRQIYGSEDEGKRFEFIDYCHQFALLFYDDNDWIFTDELVHNVPLKVNDTQSFIRNHSHFEIQDSVSYYFVNIKDIKTKDSTSPLSFEKRRIKNIIINQRKLSLLKKMKMDLYNKALAKKDFEIYEE